MDRFAAEAHLERVLPLFAQNVPTLHEYIGGEDEARALLKTVRSEEVRWNGLAVNLDIYASDPSDPVVIFHGGMANYARFYYLFLSKLAQKGFNVIAVDRPGHGFSEGERGDCRVEDVKSLMPFVLDFAKETFNDRIGMMGTSLGGITTFYLLPDLEGIRSALCHNWLYPGELADASKAWLSVFLKMLNAVRPMSSVPVRKLMDETKVRELSENPFIVDYFLGINQDPLYCESLTLRSVVSYFGGYRPEKSYRDVNIPVMGLISEKEKVLPLETSIQWWKRAGFSEDALHVFPDAKHMIFHDRLGECVEKVSAWFSETLAG